MPLESYITNFRTISIHLPFEKWSKNTWENWRVGLRGQRPTLDVMHLQRSTAQINININSTLINNNSKEICTVFVDVFHVFSNDTIYQFYIYI